MKYDKIDRRHLHDKTTDDKDAARMRRRSKRIYAKNEIQWMTRRHNYERGRTIDEKELLRAAH